MQFILTGMIFFLSSMYVSLVDYLAISSRSFQKALVLPVLFLIIALYRLPKIVKNESLSYEKWFYLFWGNIFIQMLILSTGGLQSPFIILLHLSLIGLSLLFTFSLGFLFLVFSLSIIITDSLFHQTLFTLFLNNPGSVLLEAISFVAIVPVAYIVSYKYHVKDWLFSLLRARVVTYEAILEHLDELIIVTDANLNILSVNDAVERTLMQSRSELLHKPLFMMFILKDSNGKVATKETFFPDGVTLRSHQVQNQIFTLVRSPLPQKKVTVQVQPIKDLEAGINQISFVFNYVQNFPHTGNTVDALVENARAKYEAMNENMKHKLFEKDLNSLGVQMVLMGKIEHDIFNLHMLQEHKEDKKLLRIDLAELCRKVTLQEQDLAKVFGIKLDFTIRNFGMKDITPFLAGNFTVKAEEFTGPFFTASCDVQKMELIVEKLLDICILLALSEPNPEISVSIERRGKNELRIQIFGNCPRINQESVQDLFVAYYGKLNTQTNLHLGSGLEGYLVKTATEMDNIQLDTQYKKDTQSNIMFTLLIKKNFLGPI